VEALLIDDIDTLNTGWVILIPGLDADIG
jgi:hypothetical protein